MRKDAKTPLYSGASVSKLEADLMLMQLKSNNGGMSDKGFNELLGVVHKLLPSDNELPENTYKAMQMICPLGLEVQNIHACRHDCILFRGDYAELDECPVCKASRYSLDTAAKLKCKREKRPAAKVVWYFPIIPRLKRLFANKETAKMMRWHAEECVNDGKLRQKLSGGLLTVNTRRLLLKKSGM